MWDSVVEELEGDDILQAMYVKNVKTGEVTKVEADPEDGMFRAVRIYRNGAEYKDL